MNRNERIIKSQQDIQDPIFWPYNAGGMNEALYRLESFCGFEWSDRDNVKYQCSLPRGHGGSHAGFGRYTAGDGTLIERKWPIKFLPEYAPDEESHCNAQHIFSQWVLKVGNEGAHFTQSEAEVANDDGTSYPVICDHHWSEN